MSDPVTVPGVRAVVQRHITDEETVSFEGFYDTDATARAAVEKQLALCRAHMAQYNEEVRLVDQKKSDELTDTLATKGEEIKRLDREIAEKTADLQRVVKRNLRTAG